MLGLVVARALYERHPDFPEGKLAKIRARVVSRESCAAVARELDLGQRLTEQALDVSGDELTRLASNRNVLAALVEAVLAALFLEHGFEAVEQPIVAAFAGQIEYALTSHIDYKTELQERLAQLDRRVSYSVLETEGPPHERLFTSAAQIDGEQAGVGRGRSKKEAEQAAAREVLERLEPGAGLNSEPLERRT